MPSNDRATLVTVSDWFDWTDQLFSFKTSRPPGYCFTPGQFARLGLAVNDGMVWRAYSIVSASTADHLEFYGIVVPGGLFTTALKVLRPGDPIWIEQKSVGFMTADRFVDGEALWMLATGTGLGPYISILRERDVWEKFKHIVLVHGVRRSNELAYLDQFVALQAHPPCATDPATLQLVRSVTREAAAQGAGLPGLLKGRITTLLENGTLESAAGMRLTPEASRVMLCGNPDMITDARRLLHQRGFLPCRRVIPGQFLTENYW
ncbi:ferredoxin--NADP reductase [Undibacterium arcticum]|uniref:ferredoxin--NADP(+) reductase n=1 Tax=Undibacterium arcticum TaxID=1762892 RepID=A0ABV7F342_9BURK